MDDFSDHDDDDIPGDLEDDIEIIELYEDSDDDSDIEESEGFDSGGGDGPSATNLAAPSRNDAKVTFRGHDQAVFSCEVNSSNTYVVSGGEDDRAFVWNITNGEVLFECTGHKDSVTCVGFNHDSSLVATGDMSGLIKVWNVPSMSTIWEFETSDLRWLHWHPQANVLFAGTSDGNAWLWKVPSGECKTFQSFGTASAAGRILTDGKRAVTSYDDGTFRLWDLKTASVIHAITGAVAHTSAITSLDCASTGDLIATGSTDGSTKLTSVSNGKVVATFGTASDGRPNIPEDTELDNTSSVETVAFAPGSSGMLAVGSLTGSMSIWDVPTLVEKHSCRHPSGIVKLAWNGPHHVITAGLDGVIRAWDARSGQLARSWEGHTAEILDFALSPDGKTIVTASEDCNCAVYKDLPE